MSQLITCVSSKLLIGMGVVLTMLGCDGDSGAFGADAAKRADQKASPGITQARQAGMFSGTSTNNSYTCDASFELIAWCETSKVVVWCDAGTWRALPCERVAAGSSCAITDDNEVDCR